MTVAISRIGENAIERISADRGPHDEAFSFAMDTDAVMALEGLAPSQTCAL